MVPQVLWHVVYHRQDLQLQPTTGNAIPLSQALNSFENGCLPLGMMGAPERCMWGGPRWTSQQHKVQSNYLELLAVGFTFHLFKNVVKNQVMSGPMDNTRAVQRFLGKSETSHLQ